MRYGKFYSFDLRKEIQQINRVKAERLYNQGIDIFVQSCNMRFDNVWQQPCRINIKDDSWCADNFKLRMDDYSYYNCDNERGKYPCFFIIVE